MVLRNKHIQSDDDLVQQVAAGDVDAFRLVYDHFYLPVFRFARKYTGHHQVAEDITTDSFLKLWEQRAGFSEWAKLKSFLFTTVRNACINWLRDEKRHASHRQRLLRIMDVNPEMDYELTRHPVAERVFHYLEDEINRLPEKMKTILLLQLNGYSNQEIAMKIGLAEKSVRNLKVEALKTLRVGLLKKGDFALLLFTFLFKL